MSVQVGIGYTTADGSLTDAGYALLKDQERAIAELKAEIAVIKQTLIDNGIT